MVAGAVVGVVVKVVVRVVTGVVVGMVVRAEGCRFVGVGISRAVGSGPVGVA